MLHQLGDKLSITIIQVTVTSICSSYHTIEYNPTTIGGGFGACREVYDKGKEIENYSSGRGKLSTFTTFDRNSDEGKGGGRLNRRRGGKVYV